MKTKELVQKLHEGVQGVFQSERFQQWLKLQARFHDYSAANTLLILLQKPEAKQVAGFQTWKKLGRKVKKGEKGIAILAPLVKKVKTEDESELETAEEQYISGFRTVYVFDVRQTEGDELPELAREMEGNSLEAAALVDKLYLIADNLGLRVITYTEGHRGAMGYFNPVKQEIGLKHSSQDQMAKTLLHELAHVLTKNPDYTYQQGEIIAEGTAFVVATYFGLDTSNYSFEYVAGWSSRQERPAKGEKGKVDPLKQTATIIQQTAKQLIQMLEKKSKDDKALAG